jgi:hypothetical protein
MLGTGKESMWVWGCGGEREKLKTEMLKVRENGKCWGQGKRVCGCGGMWVWEGKRNAEKLKC